MAYVRACAVSDLVEDSAIAVEVGDEDVAIVRSGGEVFAIRDECSHASIPLSEGDVGQCEIECYLHGSRFDLRTGDALGLPATEAVPVYAVRVTDGEVYVDLDAPPGRPTPVGGAAAATH